MRRLTGRPPRMWDSRISWRSDSWTPPYHTFSGYTTTIGPCPHCEKQPALLMRTSTCLPAWTAPARKTLTNFSTSPCCGQVSPEVHTNTWQRYCPMSLPRLSEEAVKDVEPRQVVVHGVHHEHHQQHEPDLLRDLALAHGDGPPEDRLADEEEQVAAVEHGHGQQVEHGEVDADQRGEEREIGQALSCLLPRRGGDLDGATDVGGRELRGQEFEHALDRHVRPLPRLEHAVLDGDQRIRAHEHRARS